MSSIPTQLALSRKQTWSAVGSMALSVALLIASEFMPVSLLTPITQDLHATDGIAGQAISISGLFAVATSLFIATVAGRFDRQGRSSMRPDEGGGKRPCYVVHF